MGFSWVSTEARTGTIITDLPELRVDAIKASVGRYETATASLPIVPDLAPADWERAIQPNGSHLILLADNPDDPAHGIPIIGYLINEEVRSEGDTVELDLATIESYLDGRFVGDVTYTNVGQNAIVADLINRFVKDGAGGRQGIPLRVQYTTPGAGTPRVRSFADADDKTIYSVLTELSGVIGGPEWYCGWEWQTNPERLTPVLFVGDRVGTPIQPGFGPAATFELPGSIASFRRSRSYKQGRGANDVMATSSGDDGATRPQSPRRVLIDLEQPTVEFRFSPSTSITSIDTLTSHADVAVSAMHAGSVSVEMSAAAEDGPLLGVDWGLGDDVGFDIGRPDSLGRSTVPSVPNGYRGTARVAGWELTLAPTPIVSPTLVAITEESA